MKLWQGLIALVLTMSPLQAQQASDVRAPEAAGVLAAAPKSATGHALDGDGRQPAGGGSGRADAGARAATPSMPWSRCN